MSCVYSYQHIAFIGGIGSSVGSLLRSQGAKLALLYAPFEADKVESILDGVYGTMSRGEDNNVKAYPCDVTDPASVAEAFEAIIQDRAAFPSMLINAAGYVALSPFEKTPPQDSLKHYMVNLYGPTLTSRAFAHILVATLQPDPHLAASLTSQAKPVTLHSINTQPIVLVKLGSSA
jgi:NAD(P)-dependent dehydrogenase (short-subunit alcohol dehydrogenase family)